MCHLGHPEMAAGTLHVRRLDVIQVGAGVVLGERPADQSLGVKPAAGRLVGVPKAADVEAEIAGGHFGRHCTTARPQASTRGRRDQFRLATFRSSSETVWGGTGVAAGTPSCLSPFP